MLDKDADFYYQKLSSSLNSEQMSLVDELIKAIDKAPEPEGTIRVSGIELLNRLKSGFVHAPTWILVEREEMDNYTIIKYDGFNFKWVPGTFNAGEFVANNVGFTILDTLVYPESGLPDQIKLVLKDIIRKAFEELI